MLVCFHCISAYPLQFQLAEEWGRRTLIQTVLQFIQEGKRALVMTPAHLEMVKHLLRLLRWKRRERKGGEGAQADDRAIKEEGIGSLTEEELRSACRARGIRAPYGEYAIPFMRRQLDQWLELSLDRWSHFLVPGLLGTGLALQPL